MTLLAIVWPASDGTVRTAIFKLRLLVPDQTTLENPPLPVNPADLRLIRSLAASVLWRANTTRQLS